MPSSTLLARSCSEAVLAAGQAGRAHRFRRQRQQPFGGDRVAECGQQAAVDGGRRRARQLLVNDGADQRGQMRLGGRPQLDPARSRRSGGAAPDPARPARRPPGRIRSCLPPGWLLAGRTCPKSATTSAKANCRHRLVACGHGSFRGQHGARAGPGPYPRDPGAGRLGRARGVHGRAGSDGFVVLGGPVGDRQRVLLAIEAACEPAIRARLAADPWAAMGLRRIGAVEPWALWLDGRRQGVPCSSAAR